MCIPCRSREAIFQRIEDNLKIDGDDLWALLRPFTEIRRKTFKYLVFTKVGSLCLVLVYTLCLLTG
jgi:hypothetical protein